MTDKPVPDALPMLADNWQCLAEWLRAADIDCLEIDVPGVALRMVRCADVYRFEGLEARALGPGLVVGAPAAACAPCVGVFLDRHPLDADSLASQGARVEVGARVGYLRVGVLLVPVVAPVAGTIAGILAPAGSLVGYGTRLIAIVEGTHDGD